MLSLDDLRFFSAVASAKSLAATARALDVTPPAVSQRLAGLERKMGVRLIERERNGIRLTDEGDLVAARARAILQELEDLESEVAARRDELSGPLRVAAPLGFGRRYLGPLISRFHEDHPGVSVDLALSDRPPEANARIDIAVHIGELRDTSAILVKLAPNDRIVCASPDYLARAGTPTELHDLQRLDCLALRENDEDSTLWRFTRGDQHLSVRVRPTWPPTTARSSANGRWRAAASSSARNGISPTTSRPGGWCRCCTTSSRRSPMSWPCSAPRGRGWRAPSASSNSSRPRSIRRPGAEGGRVRGARSWGNDGRDGGRDRDRTCDPLDVNEVLSR